MVVPSLTLTVRVWVPISDFFGLRVSLLSEKVIQSGRLAAE